MEDASGNCNDAMDLVKHKTGKKVRFAVPESDADKDSQVAVPRKSTTSYSSDDSCDSLANETLCVICGKERIARGFVTMYTKVATKLYKAALIVYAERRKDTELLSRIKTDDIVFLHFYCWRKYAEKFHKRKIVLDDKLDKNIQEIVIVNGLHKIAYLVIYNFIEDLIIDKGQSITLQELELQYRIILFTLNEPQPLNLDDYSYYNLNKIILKNFAGKVVIEKCGTADQEILHKAGIDCATIQQATTNVSWTYKQIKQAILDNSDWPGI